MKIIASLFLLLSSLLLMTSCGDKDSEERDCLESEILIENRCEENISISYFELDDGFNLIEELLNVDGCDITEKNRTVSSGSSIEIVVFEGSCAIDSESGFDSCNGFISDEVIVVQYGDKDKEYPIYGTDQIEIVPSQFN